MIVWRRCYFIVGVWVGDGGVGGSVCWVLGSVEYLMGGRLQ